MFSKLFIFKTKLDKSKIFINKFSEGKLDELEYKDDLEYSNSSNSSSVIDLSSSDNSLNKSTSISDIQSLSEQYHDKELKPKELEEKYKPVYTFKKIKCFEGCQCIKCLVPIETWFSISKIMMENNK